MAAAALAELAFESLPESTLLKLNETWVLFVSMPAKSKRLDASIATGSTYELGVNDMPSSSMLSMLDLALLTSLSGNG